MDHTPGLSVSFIGRHVALSVSPAERLEGRILSGDWELGPARNYMLFQIKVAPGARFIDGDVIEYAFEMTKNVQEGRTKP